MCGLNITKGFSTLNLTGCNLCGLTAAGEIPSSEQEALYGHR